MTALDARFRGNVPALVTPCRAGGAEPDPAGMKRLVEHVMQAGVDAVSILGSTGEFSLVPPDHRGPIICAAVGAAAGRVPVMVGCGRPGLAETIAEIAAAADCGADAVLVTPSYYFPLPDAEVRRFFHGLAAAAPVPLLYYNYPQMTGARPSAATIAALARDGVLAGAKDSSGDAVFLARLAAEVAALPGFRLFVGGSGFLLGALAHGAAGVIGALSNFAAPLDNAVLAAMRDGDLPRARQAQARITRAVDLLFFGTPRNPASVAKAILAAAGVCGEDTYPPLEPLSSDERRALLRALPSLGILDVDPEQRSHSP
ncbi:MAG: dihydrodipicolinate synthase family protein [Dongiaceae bacterium]